MREGEGEGCVRLDLRCLVVSNVRIERCDEHQARLHELIDALAVGDDADDARAREALRRVGEEARRGEEVGDHDWLEDVELKVALRASEGDGRVIAHNLRARTTARATREGAIGRVRAFGSRGRCAREVWWWRALLWRVTPGHRPS